MQAHGDFYGRGYLRLERLMPPEVTQNFLAMLKMSLDHSKVQLPSLLRPGEILGRPAIEIHSYQFHPMQTLLWGLTPTMGALVGRDLMPTYCYFRVYQKGDVLRVHSDREACEVSASLTLGYSDDQVWPLEIGRARETQCRKPTDDFAGEGSDGVALMPGDAILYQGVHYRHGRTTPNPNRWSAHLFLHWVDTAGVYKNQAFDSLPVGDKVDFGLS
jgi:hypothetical protein